MASRAPKANRKGNPSLTKNGKTRIKGFSVDKLKTTMDNSSRPRDKDKIQRRIKQLEKRSA